MESDWIMITLIGAVVLFVAGIAMLMFLDRDDPNVLPDPDQHTVIDPERYGLDETVSEGRPRHP